jgi:hypothetical protein
MSEIDEHKVNLQVNLEIFGEVQPHHQSIA